MSLRTNSKAVLLIIPAVLLGVGLSGCGRTMDWMQDAPLHDGRTLVVERRSEFGPSFPGNSGMEIGQTLTFRHPETKERIAWRIPEGLLPVMIDFERGVPYYVLTGYTVSDYNKWGCPNPPYLVYRYEQGKWSPIAFEALPEAFISRNLVNMSKGIRDLKDGGRVSVTGLENFWSEVERPTPRQEARVLSRKKISPIAKGCYDDILIKQGRQSEIDNRR